jgi:mono-ADP-ribosyltransferase sirtuin 6
MSAGYAARLKDYRNKGVCGLPEVFDTPRLYASNLQKLASLVRISARVVVLTGAGISTSAGLPDFRGPKGVWTVEKKQQREKNRNKKASTSTMKSRKRKASVLTTQTTDKSSEVVSCSSDFATAKPTYTHRALTFLVQEKVVDFVVTQNVDGLHRRSGLSRNSHAVLHGCAFTENCERCKTEHFREYDVGGMSFQKTGRSCEICQGDLHDTLLDWDDPLPQFDLERAERHCQNADLVITLGTSLRIHPAADLPLMAKKMVIVNLQETPVNAKAELVIREHVDKVMADLMELLGYPKDWEEKWDTYPPPKIERLWKWTPLPMPQSSKSEDTGNDDRESTYSSSGKESLFITEE